MNSTPKLKIRIEVPIAIEKHAYKKTLARYKTTKSYQNTINSAIISFTKFKN